MEPTMNALRTTAIVTTLLACGLVVLTIADLPEVQPALSAALRFGPVI
jgi:hypothetical protein